MTRVTFVLISVSDRLDALNALLDTIVADRRWDPIDCCLLFQDPDGVADGIRHRDRLTQVFIEPELLGCHGARVHLLRRIRYDAYINLDDDILLGPHTNFWPAVRKAQEPDVGFVITAWARTPTLLAKKLPAPDSFSKQIMVYNGGGMAYADKIADLMRALEPVKTAFDCAWPITAYVHGYTNQYYHGSLSVHRVCGTGGMHAFMKATPLHLMGGEWLRFRPCLKTNGSCTDMHIPLDPDVLPAAKVEHVRQRRAKFGY